MMAVHLTGTLTCTTLADVALVTRLLPDHIRLSQAEPGCALFAVTQTSNPMVWSVTERFSTRADFDAHQTRTQASLWGQSTQHIARNFVIRDA